MNFNARSHMTSAENSQDEVILAERIRAYFSESRVQVIAGAVVVTTVALVARNDSPFWLLAVALLSIYVITFVRLRQAWLFSKTPDSKSYADWGKVQTWCAGLAGVAWALAFVPMLPHLPTEYQFLIIAVCAVSVATAVSEGFSYVWPSFAFSLALLLPVIAWLAYQATTIHLALALLLTIFLPMVMWQSMQRGKVYVQAIMMRLHNENLADELTFQRDLAEKASKDKTRFLAAASHDLRQPVAAAHLFVDALKFSSPSAEQSKLIGQLDQSIGVFSNQLERLLDISRFDAGLIKPELKSINLTELFSWLEQTFANAAHEKGLRFMLHLPRDRALAVKTDIALIESVLMNLVSNAIKFTPRGGILIGARMRQDAVILQVWDTGIGIDPALVHKIYDEFYQIDNPQRNRVAGLGLGLSISKRAAALLGSSMTCRSRPGRGSVFELCLPIAHQENVQNQAGVHSSPVPELDPPRFKDKAIVVLEDDALVREALVSLLQGIGANVFDYANAESALKDPRTVAADFFVVDYSLGGNLTGSEFLDVLQGNLDRKIRAVIVTGETSPGSMSKLSTQPWPVLHKPVNLARLVSLL